MTGVKFYRVASALPSIYNYKVATVLTNNNPLDKIITTVKWGNLVIGGQFRQGSVKILTACIIFTI